MQPDAFADAVVVMVKNALTPVLERMAAAEARLAALADVRDRLVVVETKSAQPLQAATVDLEPIRTVLAKIDTRDLEYANRVDDVAKQVGELVKECALLRERVAVAEVRPMTPGPAGKDGADGLNGKDGRDGIDGTHGVDGAHGRDGKDGVNGKDGADGLNGKDGVAGRDGVDGKDGAPGLNGKDGADGVGWDDLALEQVDERTVVVKCAKGLQVKEVGRLTFPVEIYRGVYVEGKQYERGDCTTYGGSEWHCNQPTSAKPGDGSKSWTLKVKKGRDGKDALPVVSARQPSTSTHGYPK